MVATGTGSSATTSGLAVELLACAPLSWASSGGGSSFDLSLLLFFFFFLGGPVTSSWSRSSTTSSSASRGHFLPWLEASGARSVGLLRVPSPSESVGNFAGSPRGSYPPEPHSSPATRWEVAAFFFASDFLPCAFSC